MYIYVDESGNTGANIFDPAQPVLFYGVLSSAVSVDVLAERRLARLRRRLGVQRLHANELRNEGLSSVAEDLLTIQKKLDLRFDFYRVRKIDHAAICFFDQVFDQGVNPAVPWHAYWTPLRYLLLMKVRFLFDEDLLRDAWEARLTINDDKAERILQSVCAELLGRTSVLPDVRTREIVTDALNWAIANTSELSYNASSKASAIGVMPNAVGFQLVLMGIANRLRQSSSKKVQITIDRQSQFNKAQTWIDQQYQSLKGTSRSIGPGLPELDLRGMPDTKIMFSSVVDSAGIELVDIYLWLFKRMYELRDIPSNLEPLINRQILIGQTDEISLEAIERRWSRVFEKMMHAELTDEQLATAKKLVQIDETRRKRRLMSDGH